MDHLKSKTVYTAAPDSIPAYWSNVWLFRRFIWVLAKRDLKIKYAQTILGLLWTVLQPLSGLLIFSVFFNHLIKLEGIPESGYAVFAFTGMISWYLFSYIVYHSSTSLINGQELIHKIYFPKIVLPLSKVLVGLADLGICLMLLFIIMLVQGIGISWKIVFLPIFIVLNVITGLAISVWLSALTVRVRDLQHIVPYVVNFGIWMTPVFFPSTLVPEQFEWLLFINPMAGVVEGFRWSIWEYGHFDPRYWVGMVMSIAVFASAVWYFKVTEDKMVDLI